MHPQLETLLEMQDLHMQHRSLEEGEVRELESGVFEMSVDGALETLKEKIAELAMTLPGDVQERYRRVIGTRERVVVPVLAGICYGCFTAVPTAWSATSDPNDQLNVCQHCGCFLYHPH